MPLSHDVAMPIGVEPEWPDCCILCAAPAPDSTFRFRASYTSWLAFFFWIFWLLGRRPVVRVPSCTDCARELRRRRRRRKTLELCVVYLPVAIIASVAAFTDLKFPFGRWGFFTAIGVPIFFYIIWSVIRPLDVDATAMSKVIEYEFLDPDAAKMFETANHPLARNTDYRSR